jgi:hypothetical protein
MWDFTLINIFVCLGLFLAMIGAVWIGWNIGVRHTRTGDGKRSGVGGIEGAIYGLFSLILAFSFYGAASRYDARRQLIVEEANNIGTAYLRIDLLQPPAQVELRDAFRRYASSRIEVYKKLPDIDAAYAELARSNEIQREIWTKSVVAGRDIPPPSAALLLTALNSMIDITTTRTMATRLHPPTITFVMLIGFALAASLLAGYTMGDGRRSRLHVVLFAAITAFTIFVIFDMEYPRLGLIRVDQFDQVLVDQRLSMN